MLQYGAVHSVCMQHGFCCSSLHKEITDEKNANTCSRATQLPICKSQQSLSGFIFWGNHHILGQSSEESIHGFIFWGNHILGQPSEESIHGDLLVHNHHNNQQAPGYIGVTTVVTTIVRVNNISPIHPHPNSQAVGVSSKRPFPDCQ